MSNTHQAAINNAPPIGVTIPITLKLILEILIVDNKYIDPEKNITPIMVNAAIVFLVLTVN